MATDKNLAAARKVYNALKDTDRRAFEKAVFEWADSKESDGFRVFGINFDLKYGSGDKSAMVWGRYEDEEYERGDNDSYTISETVNRYNVRYITVGNYRKYHHR